MGVRMDDSVSGAEGVQQLKTALNVPRGLAAVVVDGRASHDLGVVEVADDISLDHNDRQETRRANRMEGMNTHERRCAATCSASRQ